MLRAVGMTRRQVSRMIRHESVITALIGAALGLPLGIFLAADGHARALDQYDLQFALPTVSLIVFVLVPCFVGAVAAIIPARRAARLKCWKRCSTSSTGSAHDVIR